ncbi:hypothetical protein M1494_02605 [Candidatus Parvarchaeota archaeon]|nr:hypothetical protein [Candidatus Parvarchaeota archaeon]
MSYNKKGQYSIEYTIIIGIGISIIAAFVIYVALFYGSFASGSAASQITTVSSDLANEVSYVASQGPGSMQAFPITIPLIQSQYSFFCGNLIKLQTTTELGISDAIENVSGMLPLSGGTFDAFARDENGSALIGLDFSISLIQLTYSLSSNILSYSMSFYNYSNDLKGTSFNVSLFSTDGLYLTSVIGSTSSGQATGTLTLPSAAPRQYVLEVYPTGSGDYYSTCISVS